MDGLGPGKTPGRGKPLAAGNAAASSMDIRPAAGRLGKISSWTERNGENGGASHHSQVERRYPSMAWYELRRSFSRELFCRSLQATGTRNPARRPGHRRLRGAGAGHLTGRRPGPGLPVDSPPQRPARVERPHPGSRGLAGHRGGDRRHDPRGGLSGCGRVCAIVFPRACVIAHAAD